MPPCFANSTDAHLYAMASMEGKGDVAVTGAIDVAVASSAAVRCCSGRILCEVSEGAAVVLAVTVLGL